MDLMADFSMDRYFDGMDLPMVTQEEKDKAGRKACLRMSIHMGGVLTMVERAYGSVTISYLHARSEQGIRARMRWAVDGNMMDRQLAFAMGHHERLGGAAKCVSSLACEHFPHIMSYAVPTFLSEKAWKLEV